MTYRKLALAIVTAGSLSTALIGCGGDSHSYDETPEISGVAAKGFLNAANVVITNAALTNLASGVTDSSGVYNLLIPRADTTVVINVTPTPTTTMICDSPSGCSGGTSLGDTLTASQLGDFSLQTIGRVASGENTELNVNALTTIAAQVLQDSVTRAGSSLASMSASQLASTQRAATRTTLRLFGLSDTAVDAMGDDLNIFDLAITDAANGDVAGLSDSAKLLTAVNASVASLSSTTLQEALGSLVTVATAVASGTADTATLSTQLAALLATVNTAVTSINSGPSFNITSIDTTIITDTTALQNTLNDTITELENNILDGLSGGTGVSSGSSGGTGGSF